MLVQLFHCKMKKSALKKIKKQNKTNKERKKTVVMKTCRKIYVVVSNFDNKIISGMNFGKKVKKS